METTSFAVLSLRRDPAPQSPDIQVVTPKRGSTQRITAKYAAKNRIISSHCAMSTSIVSPVAVVAPDYRSRPYRAECAIPRGAAESVSRTPRLRRIVIMGHQLVKAD